MLNSCYELFFFTAARWPFLYFIMIGLWNISKWLDICNVFPIIQQFTVPTLGKNKEASISKNEWKSQLRKLLIPIFHNLRSVTVNPERYFTNQEKVIVHYRCNKVYNNLCFYQTNENDMNHLRSLCIWQIINWPQNIFEMLLEKPFIIYFQTIFKDLNHN